MAVYTSGLPDGKFSYQKSQFGNMYFKGLLNGKYWHILSQFVVFYVHWYMLCPFGIFSVIWCMYFPQFWYIVTRKIWQS
jgi:hypothetical protein